MNFLTLFPFKAERGARNGNAYEWTHELPRLDRLIESYGYDRDFGERFAPYEKKLWDRQRNFGDGVNNYGRQMIAHSVRVAYEGANFMRFIGFSDRACANFEAAMKFHDLGKTHDCYDPGIWTLPNRPTPEQREDKRRHARLGVEVLDEVLADAPELAMHPHIILMKALMVYHHERADGNGPEGMKRENMPLAVQASCIVDAYDGDRMRRPHQTHQRTPGEALERMAAMNGEDKYAGAFDRDMIWAYARIKDPDSAAKILQDA